ncbi:unnamed protein product [Dovyalis caffra]|uniref:Uncharacterized protein n=1 Tax=Dovyalis caffra TaxID=77055 RepID=A0AAV1SJY2_9ROSI|nr:unnamed protein product [Dovyalis caffra]
MPQRKKLKEKVMKRQTLIELVDYVSSANGKFLKPVMQHINANMLSINLFRTLISAPRENKILEAFHLEEDEPSIDPA